MSRLKFKIPLFGLLTLLFYMLLLYLNNSYSLIVKMNYDNLSPKIYYTFNNEPFSEKNSISKTLSKGSSYYFNLPKHLELIRFDPTVRSNVDIVIHDILVLKNRWFNESMYKIDLNSIKPKFQVKDFNISKGIIKFNTTGRDSQLIFSFKPIKLYSQKNYHFEFLMLSAIISLIIIYLLEIYKTKEFNDNLLTKIILYSLFLGFISFKAYYYKENIHFGYPPDETYHYKYVEYVNNNLSFTPKFEEMPHYLAHPPLYYEIVSTQLSKNKSKRENVNNIRTLSMLIFILATLLILYLGFSSNLTILGDFVYLSFISSIPMFAYIGGSISNDNLAILGAIIAVIGLKRLIDKKYNFSTYLIVAIGGLLAYFAKLTAAILLFFAVIYYILYLLFTKEMPKITKKDIFVLVLVLVPIIYYQASIMLKYHAITPTYNVTHPKEFLESSFYTPPEYRVHLTKLEWAKRMLHYIQGGWFGIHSHHSFGHEKWSGVFSLVILHTFAIFALLFRCKNSFCKLGKITLLALFSVLVVQFFFSYKAHINNGYMGGLQPRYVLPFMFAFAIMASVFVERFKKSFWFSIVVIAISIHAIYSDFFYFLLYYN